MIRNWSPGLSTWSGSQQISISRKCVRTVKFKVRALLRTLHFSLNDSGSHFSLFTDTKDLTYYICSEILIIFWRRNRFEQILINAALCHK